MSASVILMHASLAAEKRSALKCHHLMALGAVSQGINVDTVKILFKPTHGYIGVPLPLEIVYDTAMRTATEEKGRSGNFIFRPNGDVAHPIQWNVRKIRHVASSRRTADILNATEEKSMGMFLETVFANVLQVRPLEHTADSISLLSLATSIHDP